MTEVDTLRVRARRLLETIWEGYWDEWHETAILAAFEDVTRVKRRACSCPVPDPVMQADGKFYCHACSFETGARPSGLEPENVLSSPMAAGLLVKLKEECEAQHERAEAERRAREAAEQALRDLVQAIDEMSNDEQYKAAFLALHVHGFAYSGRQIVTELEAAKAALAATRQPGSATP